MELFEENATDHIFKKYYFVSESNDITWKDINEDDLRSTIDDAVDRYNYTHENTGNNELYVYSYMFEDTPVIELDSIFMNESIEDLSNITNDNIPQEIVDFNKDLNTNFMYGVVYNGQVITDLNNFDFGKEYRSLTTRDFIKYKAGVCWDYVHYEAQWFEAHGYRHEEYYIEVKDKDGMFPTHTFLLFTLHGSSKVYYFESSWKKYAGIEEFPSRNAAVLTIIKRHKYFTGNPSGHSIFVKFNAMSKEFESLSCTDYMIRASKRKTHLLKMHAMESTDDWSYIMEGSNAIAETSQYIEKYRAKCKKFSEITGEERIPRTAMNPVDNSLYQKFQKNDKVRNNVDVKGLINENTYLISDLHFGEYDKEYDQKNIEMINKIPKNSVLLILGDIGYNKIACREYIKECFSQIQCQNVFLVLGNHDCYSLDFYYDELGIKGVYEYIYILNKGWVFTHQPADGPMEGLINFHGHLHEEKTYMRVTGIENKINCWEGYCLNRLRTLREWFNDNLHRPKNKILLESTGLFNESGDDTSNYINLHFDDLDLFTEATASTILRDFIYPKVESVLRETANVRKFNLLVSKFINRNIEKLTTSGPVYLVPFTDNDKNEYYQLFGVSDKDIKKLMKEHTAKLNNSKFKLLTQNPIFTLFYFVIRYFTLHLDKKSLNSALTIYALSAYPSIYTKYFPHGVIEPVMKYTIDNLTDKFLIRKTNHILGLLVESISRSYTFLKPFMKESPDSEVVRWIQRIRNDHNSMFKKIANIYMENHKKGYGISTTNTQYDDDTPIIDEVDNATSEVQNAVLKVSLPIIQNGVDIMRAEASARMAGIGVSDCRTFLIEIITDKNTDSLQKFIESILFLYLYEGKKSIRDIRSQYFLAWAASLFKKTNSKNNNIIRINQILNKWAEDSGIHKKFQREASRINYKKAIFFYVVLSIQKYIA